jgi:integrase
VGKSTTDTNSKITFVSLLYHSLSERESEMASIFKRKLKTKTTYRVIVRRKGFKTLVKTFNTKPDAIKWGREMERNLDRGISADFSESGRVMIGDLMKRYLKENKHRHKKGWRTEEYTVGSMLKDPITDVNLLSLGSKDIADFRDRRLEVVSPTTFNKNLSFINVVIDIAIIDWGYALPFNPCKQFKRLREPYPRNRRLEGDEEKRLIEASALSDNIYLKPMIQFSIETAIRQGELLKLTHRQINWNDRTMTLLDTKNGEDRVVPLSEKAYLILKTQIRRLDDKMFPMTKDSLKFWFKQAKRRAKIEGFRWHDIRRHACSMLFEKGLSVPEVQLMSGHKDPKILLNTYTKLDPRKLVKKLG